MHSCFSKAGPKGSGQESQGIIDFVRFGLNWKKELICSLNKTFASEMRLNYAALVNKGIFCSFWS